MSIRQKRTDHAIRHLKNIKPYDGWSADNYLNSTGKNLVMLRRRNAPLSNSGYTEIVYDEDDTKCIIGLTSHIGDTGLKSFYRGIVLVEKDGSVARDQREVRVTLSKTFNSLNSKHEENRKKTKATHSHQEERMNKSELLDEQPSELTKLGLVFICVVTALRILSSFAFAFNAILFPLVLLSATQNCPSNDTFEAKKELKRVLRGQHLPDGHDNKPSSDWLSQTVARVTASVVAEASTVFGYEVSFTSIGGACTIATVTVPSISLAFYWIGAFGSWRFIMKKDLPHKN